MHSEIELVKGHLIGLYERQREYLKSKPTSVLEELKRAGEAARFEEEFSTRTAGEINRTACEMILEERGKR
jgi:hypothetical protein